MSKLNTVLATAALAASFAAWNASSAYATLTFELLNTNGIGNTATGTVGSNVTLGLWANITQSGANNSGLYDAIGGAITSSGAAGGIVSFTPASQVVADAVTPQSIGTTVTGVNLHADTFVSGVTPYGLPLNVATTGPTAGLVELGTVTVALTSGSGSVSLNYVAPGSTTSTSIFQDIWAENYTYTATQNPPNVDPGSVTNVMTNSTTTNPGTVAVGSAFTINVGAGSSDLYIDKTTTHTVVGTESWTSINKADTDPNNSNPTGGALVIPSGTSISIVNDSTTTRQTRPIVTVLDSLSIVGTGHFNISDHDLIIHSTDTTLGTIDQIQAWVAAGNIATTSGTAGNAIGYARAGDVSITNFDGEPVATTDILVKYTYVGDADLSGVVNGNDFLRWQAGFGTGGTLWSQGDFHGSGTTNGNDFLTWQNGFGGPSTQLAAGAVPEPMSLGLLGVGVLGMMTRRRSRSTNK